MAILNGPGIRPERLVLGFAHGKMNWRQAGREKE